METITCSVCDKKVRSYCKCPLCQRLVCSECWHFELEDDYDGDSIYKVYCKPCWEVGEVYRNKISKAEDNYLDLVENLTKEWHNKCRKN